MPIEDWLNFKENPYDDFCLKVKVPGGVEWEITIDPAYSLDEVYSLAKKFLWRMEDKPLILEDREGEWIYCLVGNVVQEHPWGPADETGQRQIRKGSKHFRPGARVYGYRPRWGSNGLETIVVIGKARRIQRMLTVTMKTSMITNWRLKKIYDPQILEMMKSTGGWDSSYKSRHHIEDIVTYFQTGQYPTPPAET